MAALLRSQKISKCLQSYVHIQKRNVSKSQFVAAAWNKDYMPSTEVVKTPEQLEEVSKKYNIPPELYHTPTNPYGDYPDAGEFSVQQRDPTYHWDDYVHKRDFGEFMDLKYNIYSEDRCDPLYARRNRYSLPVMLASMVLLFVVGPIFVLWIQKNFPYNKNHFDKQRPYNQKTLEYVTFNSTRTTGNFDRNVHYTFEPAE